MTRPHRIDFDGAWHHLTNRGRNQERIYRDDEDCERFLSLLHKATERTGIEFHAYALMFNHYHLMARTPASGLSAAMHLIGGEYAQHFNEKYRADGALCKGRFHAVNLDDERHLVEVPRYIHNNPVKAGIVDDPAQYRWSSHASYVGAAPIPNFLTTEVIIGRWFDTPNQFDAFVKQRACLAAKDYASIVEAPRLIHRASDAALPDADLDAFLSLYPDARVIIEFSAQSFNLQPQELVKRNRGARSGATALALALMIRHAIAPTSEIASVFGYRDRSGVTKTANRFEQRCRTDKVLAELLRQGSLLLKRTA